jgi:hypothetical protein
MGVFVLGKNPHVRNKLFFITESLVMIVFESASSRWTIWPETQEFKRDSIVEEENPFLLRAGYERKRSYEQVSYMAVPDGDQYILLFEGPDVNPEFQDHPGGWAKSGSTTVIEGGLEDLGESLLPKEMYAKIYSNVEVQGYD